jgi:Flp pilus assembly pilin Flp
MLALFNICKPYLTRLSGNDEGQAAFEYVMLLVLVAVAAFITSPSMTDSVQGVINGTSSILEDGMS